MKFIGFTNPLMLLLLIGIVPLWLWSARSQADLSALRKKISLAVRIVIYACLVLALAGMRIYLPTDELSVVFLVDDTESAPENHRAFAHRFIEESIGHARAKDGIQVALFGEDAYLDQVIDASRKVVTLSTLVRREHTDISQAVNFARALFPEGVAKRIVLVSDGNETIGKAGEEGGLSGIRNTELWTVPYPSEKKQEVLVKRIDLPETCTINEPFELRVAVESTAAAEIKMKVFMNGTMRAHESLSLHPGENIFFLTQKVSKAGTCSFEVLIEPEEDSIVKNNRATAIAFVKGTPKVLYLSENNPGPVAGLLADAGMKVECGDARTLPIRLEDFHDYNTLIFSNLSALSLSEKQMRLVKSYVNDMGGGFLMIGGKNSFGIGGYYDTPVEEVLPVTMDVRKKKMLPQAAIVLVIDKSGSMSEAQGGVEKVVLAREAAIATIEMVNARDSIGVIAFDSASKWITRLSPAKHRDKMIENVATIRAGGGTNLYPPLESAINELDRSQAALKHIIVLSDGRTESGDFLTLVKRANTRKITLTTVAIGSDADIEFLRGLAEKGKGRAYYTDDASLLPRIFVKDTFIASRSAVVEEPFRPLLRESHQAFSGIDFSQIPGMAGYCLSTEKPTSTVVLVSHKNDPILALGRSGLGKSAAFTSDEGEHWAPSLFTWEGSRPFWLQLVRWTFPSVESGNYSVALSHEGEKCTIRLEAQDEEGEYLNFLEFSARVITPDLSPLDASLHQVGPGAYEGSFKALASGSYIVNIREKGGGGKTCALSIPYSPEYRDYNPNTFLLHRLAESTGGRYNPKPAEIFTHPRKKAHRAVEIWETLLLSALLLFPLDVGLRRVSLPRGWLQGLLKSMGTPRKPHERSESLETIEALKIGKKKLRDRYKGTTLGRDDLIETPREESLPRQAELAPPAPETPATG
ncbi:MAG: VWA domain-containing protein, partial [Candidatus Eremiobacteraeota bacterium]|nr:VWA domain-containing protein [Candidatus Eremiobacteraeota bacterium]